jgi:hypothetical protein
MVEGVAMFSRLEHSKKHPVPKISIVNSDVSNNKYE